MLFRSAGRAAYFFHGKRECVCIPFFRGADEQTRTADLVLTKDALYLLSYTSIILKTHLLSARTHFFLLSYTNNVC